MANLLCSKVRNYKECKVLTYLRLYKSGGLVSFWIIDISIASIRYLMCQKNGTNLVSLHCQFFSKTYYRRIVPPSDGLSAWSLTAKSKHNSYHQYQVKNHQEHLNTSSINLLVSFLSIKANLYFTT